MLSNFKTYGEIYKTWEVSLSINVKTLWFVIIKNEEIMKKTALLKTWLGFDDNITISYKEERIWRHYETQNEDLD